MKKYLFISVLILSGCVSTPYETSYVPPPLTDQYIKDINDAALCSLSVTQGEQRIYAEISNRTLDCSRSSLVCSVKGFKKGTDQFLACKKNMELKKDEVNIHKFQENNLQYQHSPKFYKQTCQHITVWLEKMECFEKSLSGNNRYRKATNYREIMAYMRVLIESVKSGKMTEAEAKYAYEQKLSEAKRQLAEKDALQRNNDRLMETMKNNQQNSQKPAPVYTNPTTTKCRPNRFDGGFNCTTYQY